MTLAVVLPRQGNDEGSAPFGILFLLAALFFVIFVAIPEFGFLRGTLGVGALVGMWWLLSHRTGKRDPLSMSERGPASPRYRAPTSSRDHRPLVAATHKLSGLLAKAAKFGDCVNLLGDPMLGPNGKLLTADKQARQMAIGLIAANIRTDRNPDSTDVTWLQYAMHGLVPAGLGRQAFIEAFALYPMSVSDEYDELLQTAHAVAVAAALAGDTDTAAELHQMIRGLSRLVLDSPSVAPF